MTVSLTARRHHQQLRLEDEALRAVLDGHGRRFRRVLRGLVAGCAVQPSDSGHQLLLSPANCCLMCAGLDHAGTTGRQVCSQLTVNAANVEYRPTEWP